ncbi:hypothetical protein AVEN_172301-1 [Araneus ventricosus]|uniref:Uncharacterized protein n=1 Tax=Araneus ventricosus TaxID=182803 RepID=A0A4Y2E4I6_ARAVE|nr:hypothetical protein AVEN_172301-1 [Araneus ventricosus]
MKLSKHTLSSTFKNQHLQDPESKDACFLFFIFPSPLQLANEDLFRISEEQRQKRAAEKFVCSERNFLVTSPTAASGGGAFLRKELFSLLFRVTPRDGSVFASSFQTIAEKERRRSEGKRGRRRQLERNKNKKSERDAA